MVIPSVHHPTLEVCIVQPQMGKLRDAYGGTANIDDVMQIFPRITKDPTPSVRDLSLADLYISGIIMPQPLHCAQHRA